MGSSKKRIQYQYDAVGNRSLMIDPDGGRFSYSYDSLNRIKTVENPQAERTTFSYDANGRRTLKLLANGTRASFTYDAASNITTLANLKSDSSIISEFDYQYDKAGNRTVSVEADGSRVTWSYDAKYQITEDYRTGTVPYRNTFMYDPAGNRLLKNESGARTTYSYDASNQLKNSIDASGTTTYTFDADGNQELVQAPNNERTTTTWNYENKTTLVQLPSGIRNTMAYEPDGLRVKIEESAGTKKFIWDDQRYLAESENNGNINAIYTNEPAIFGDLVSQYRKSGTTWSSSYCHQEALGSTIELTDIAEVVTDRYLYDAWGNVNSSSGTTKNTFQFTGVFGYYFDADTESQYIRARIYSPTIGRWMSVDPIKFADGFNLYSMYAIPNEIDPSGMATKFSDCCQREDETVDQNAKRSFGGSTEKLCGCLKNVMNKHASLVKCAEKFNCLSSNRVFCEDCSDNSEYGSYRHGLGRSSIVICQNNIGEISASKLRKVLLEEMYHSITICSGGKFPSIIPGIEKHFQNSSPGLWAIPGAADCASCVAKEAIAKACAGFGKVTLLGDTLDSCTLKGPCDDFVNDSKFFSGNGLIQKPLLDYITWFAPKECKDIDKICAKGPLPPGTFYYL